LDICPHQVQTLCIDEGLVPILPLYNPWSWKCVRHVTFQNQWHSNMKGETEINEAVDAIEGGSMNNTNNEITKPSHSRLPILTKIHVGYFFICLSFGAQALLWKSLSKHNKDSYSLWHGFNFMPSFAFLLLWCVALFIATTLSLLYVLKCIFHFDMVKEEFSHYIGVNCMYAPWISWLLMLQSAPMILHTTPCYRALCLAFSFMILVIDVKLYGQWFTTKRRFLSIVANPTSQVSVIGNLVSARVIAEIGWKESAVVMFSIGSVFYLVIFITLYQRQKSGNQFPTVLRPAYFLFFAAPSMASLAWKSILGAFVTPSKMLLFLSFFLFMSQVLFWYSNLLYIFVCFNLFDGNEGVKVCCWMQACRPAMFKKSIKRLNVTWWLYSFPLTFLGLACGEYAEDVKSGMAPWLMLVICMVSVLVFIALMIVTVLRIEMLLNKSAPFISWEVENMMFYCRHCSLFCLVKKKEYERICVKGNKNRWIKFKVISYNSKSYSKKSHIFSTNFILKSFCKKYLYILL